MNLKFIGIAATIMMITGIQAHAETYYISREGSSREGTAITIKRIDTGARAPEMPRTYIKDQNGNLRDPVTGRPKGQEY